MKTRISTAAFRKAFATGATLAGIAAMFAVSAGIAAAQDAPPPPPQDGGGQQRGPGGGGFRMGGPRMGLPHSMQLVNRPDVGRDLDITQDQREQIRDIMDQAREKMGPPPGGGQGGGQGGPPDGGQGGEQGGPPGGGGGLGGFRGPGGPGGQGMQARMEKAQSEIDKAIDKVLSSAQVKRLKEIKLQLAGSSAVLDKEIQSKIGITDDQKEQIDAAVKAQRQKMGPPPGGGQGGQIDGFGGPPNGGGGGQGGGFGGPGGEPGGQGGPQARLERAKKELNSAIDAILTSDQKAALKTMAGAKTFVEDRRPQRRGGFGGPGGGPGGQGGGLGGPLGGEEN